MTNIVLICPCDIEYNKCKEILGLSKEDRLKGRKVSQDQINNQKIYAIKSGPGKIQTATATQLVIDHLSPDYIIDVGAAGSLSEKINISTIITGLCSYEYDVCPTNELTEIPDDIISETVFARNNNKQIIEEFLEKEVSDEKILLGNIASGEKNVDNTVFRDLLYMRLNAYCCNWETSAVLKTAELNDIKSMSFRVITDMADEDMQKSYNENKKKCLNYLFEIVNKFLISDYIS